MVHINTSPAGRHIELCYQCIQTHTCIYGFICLPGALKSYLRELPEPLMTFELYNDWIQASKCVLSENNAVFLKVKTCIHRLLFFQTNPSCHPAAFKIKTRGCRLCSMPVRNCPQPTTTTSSESPFPCFSHRLPGPLYVG